MRLDEHPAHTGPIAANYDEQVFSDIAVALKFIDDLNVCQALAVGAYFILTLDNVDATLAQYPPCVLGGCEIQIQDGLMILLLG